MDAGLSSGSPPMPKQSRQKLNAERARRFKKLAKQAELKRAKERKREEIPPATFTTWSLLRYALRSLDYYSVRRRLKFGIF